MKEMTNRERLLTAMRHEEPDRVPIKVWGVDPFAEPRHPSYKPLTDAVRERCDIVRGWSCDSGIFLTASDQIKRYSRTKESGHEDFVAREDVIGTPKGELVTVDLVSTVSKPGYKVKYFIESKEDVEKFLSIPYIPPKPDVSSFFKIDEETGDRGVVMASMGIDPMYHINCLMGSELFAIWSVEERDTIIELIEVMYRRCYDFVKHLLDNGVGPIFNTLGHELATVPLQSPADFDEFVTKYDSKLIELVHEYGGLVHIHCHGKVRANLSSFVQMGTDCLHPLEAPPMGDTTLAEAKKMIGRNICIEGNIQIGDIYTRTKEEMERICVEAIRDAGPGGGFILCPTASPYTPTLDDRALENYLMMIEIGREYGQYPL